MAKKQEGLANYVIHDIKFEYTNTPVLLTNRIRKQDKPITKENLHYYLCQFIERAYQNDQHLDLHKKRGKDGNEIKNRILHFESDVALLHINNLKREELYDDPSSVEYDGKADECDNFLPANVIIDLRDEHCQVAIEKTKHWGNKTDTMRNALETCLSEMLTSEIPGASLTIQEKTEYCPADKFVRSRVEVKKDRVKYIKVEITQQSKILEDHKYSRFFKSQREQLELQGIMKRTLVDEFPDNDLDENLEEKINMLSYFINYSLHNNFDMKINFQEYGDYDVGKDLVAQLGMNDICISNFQNSSKEPADAAHNLYSWLDLAKEKSALECLGVEMQYIPQYNAKDNPLKTKRLTEDERERLMSSFDVHPLYKVCDTVHQYFVSNFQGLRLFPIELFVDVAYTMDSILAMNDRKKRDNKIHDLWTEKTNHYSEIEKRQDTEAIDAEVAMFFYCLMSAFWATQTSDGIYIQKDLLSKLHNSEWNENDKALDYYNEIKIDKSIAEYSEYMKDYFAQGRRHLSEEIAAVLNGGKPKKPKDQKEKKEKPPYTLLYIDNNKRNEKIKRVTLLYQDLCTLQWIDDDVTKPDYFLSFFHGRPIECNIKWKKSNVLLTFFIKEIMKYTEHQTRVSVKSIVENQFKRQTDNDYKRVVDADKRRVEMLAKRLDCNIAIDRNDDDIYEMFNSYSENNEDYRIRKSPN